MGNFAKGLTHDFGQKFEFFPRLFFLKTVLDIFA